MDRDVARSPGRVCAAVRDDDGGAWKLLIQQGQPLIEAGFGGLVLDLAGRM